MRLSQAIQETASPASSLLLRQSRVRSKCFQHCVFDRCFRVLFFPAGGKAEDGRDELECGYVWRCDGFLSGLLLVQREEGLCRPGGVCEKKPVIFILTLSLDHG